MPRHLQFHVAGVPVTGVIHEPNDVSPAGIGLLLLHGWAGYRIGAHRMLVKLSRAAEERGIPSLRFDFRGRGDSGGDAMASTLTTMIRDTRAAARVLIDRTSAEKVALVGDCSGGEVAIGAAPHIEQCVHMILWSTPIVGASRDASDAAKKKHIALQYLSKAFRPETWAKLFSGKLQFGMIKKALLGGGKAVGEDGSEEDEHIDWRQRFFQFDGEVSFIYGGNDPTAGPTIEHYADWTRRAGRDWHCTVIEGANHAFYSIDWEQQVIDATIDAISQPSPARGGRDGR